MSAPSDPQSFDRFAAGYDLLASCERDSSFFLERLPACRRRALDVGCGSGILARDLAEHFEEVVAIDLSAPMIELARRKRSAPNLEYRLGDARALDVAGPFDLIASHTALHHVADVPAVLRAFRERLAPGGRILLVDCVSERPAVPTFMHVGGAFLRLPSDLARRGLVTAWRLFRFRLSRDWLAHLASDRYLSEAGFREVYGPVLPGAEFLRLRWFVAVVWQNGQGF